MSQAGRTRAAAHEAADPQVSAVKPIRVFGTINPQSTWGYVQRITPDGTHIVATERDDSVLVWNLKTGSLERRYSATRGRARPVVSTDGRLVASLRSDEGRNVRFAVYDLFEERLVFRCPVQRQVVAAFNRDTSLMAMAEQRAGSVRLIDLQGGVEIGVIYPRLQGGRDPTCLAFSGDGRYLALTGGRNRVEIWDLFQGGPPKERLLPARNVRIHSIGFVTGDLLLAGTRQSVGQAALCRFEFFNLSSDEQFVLQTDEKTQTGEGEFLLSDDGSVLVTFHADRCVAWDLPGGTPKSTFRFSKALISRNRSLGAALSPDNTTFYYNRGNQLLAWDVATGERSLPEEVRHTDSVTALAVSPGETLVVSGGRDGVVLLWNGEAAKPPRELMRTNGWIYGLEFLKGGAQLAICAENSDPQNPGFAGFVEILSTKTGERVHRWDLVGRAFCMGVDRRQGLLAIATGEMDDAFFRLGREGIKPELQVWNLADKSLTRKLTTFPGEHYSKVLFSTQGNSIYFVSQRSVTRWDGSDEPHPYPIQEWVQDRFVTDPRARFAQFSSEFDPDDGRLFVSGQVYSRNSRKPHFVACWSTDDSEFAWKLELKDVVGRRLVLSPDRRLLVIASGSGQLMEASRLIAVDARTGQQLSSIDSSEIAATTLRFSADGMRIFTGGEDGLLRAWDLSLAYSRLEE